MKNRALLAMPHLLLMLLPAAASAQPSPQQPRPPRQRPAQQQAAPLNPEDYGRIEGSVMHALTGEPLKKVEVQLWRGGPPGGGGDDGEAGQLAITTTEDGKFSFPKVAPGRYGVRVSKTGFTRQGSGWTNAVTPQAPAIQLAKGQSMTGVTIRMIPHGVISGRILDEDGDPVQRVSVSAYRYTYPGGRKTLSAMTSAASNDLGEFRLWGLTPGIYYVSAVPPDMSGPQVMQRQQQRRTLRESYAPTFFPSVESVDRATPIEIAPGTQALNMDIRLRRARLFSISGVITDGAAAAPANRANVQVVPVGPQGDLGRGFSARVQEGGKFAVHGLAAGSYSVRGMVFNRNQEPAATGMVKVDLNGEDLTGVNVVVQPGGSLQAIVKYDGIDASQQPPQANVRVILESMTQGFANGMAGGSTREGLTFSIPNVSADRYRMRVSGVPAGFYLRDVQLGNQDVRFTGLDFSAASGTPSGELTLTLAASPGALDGSVKDSKDQPVGNATVLLLPVQEWTGLSDQIRTSTTGVQGDYQFANLTPGEYSIIAFEEIENGAWFDPDVRQRMLREAKTVKVEKGSTAKMELRVARP